MLKFTFEKIFLFGLIIIVFSACNSVKNLTYFQKSNLHSDTLSVARAYVPKIQSGDILSIYVSSLSTEASSFFNPYNGGGAATGNTVGVSQSPGYLVDASGQIQLPLIGNIKVMGYTTAQVRDTVKSRLMVYLKEPTVIVRYLNFKITFLGEVNRPEIFNISNEVITLPEAIAMAGDLTTLAQRDSIQIIREMDGKKIFGNVSLNNREVFNSPYYYLHPNDIIYVKPSKFKAQHNDRFITLFGFGTSVLSIILIFTKL